jgi:hypothetical protein
MTAAHTVPQATRTAHLQPDGTVFPPLTPDPPAPPGYVSPVDGNPDLELDGAPRGDRAGTTRDEPQGPPAVTGHPDQSSGAPAVAKPQPSV